MASGRSPGSPYSNNHSNSYNSRYKTSSGSSHSSRPYSSSNNNSSSNSRGNSQYNHSQNYRPYKPYSSNSSYHHSSPAQKAKDSYKSYHNSSRRDQNYRSSYQSSRTYHSSNERSERHSLSTHRSPERNPSHDKSRAEHSPDLNWEEMAPVDRSPVEEKSADPTTLSTSANLTSKAESKGEITLESNLDKVDLDDIPLPEDDDLPADDIPSPKEDSANDINKKFLSKNFNQAEGVSEDSEMELVSSSSESESEPEPDSSDGANKNAVKKLNPADDNSYGLKNIQVNTFTQYQRSIYQAMPSRIILRHRKSREGQWGERSIDEYSFVKQIGEGTYGMVYLATDSQNGSNVALKRVRCESEKDGFPIFVIREIKILKQLNHRNIIGLKDVVVDKKSSKDVSFYLSFEYMNHDLMGFLESMKRKTIEIDQICYLMKQLLEGVAHCHQKGFMHRDLKCSNILIDSKGMLKLADFGLSRPYQKQTLKEDKQKFGVNSTRPYTNKVITLWYRPPELLLGSEHYTPAVDVWSLGCILAEMFLLRPLFNASTEVGMLDVIFRMCGTPNPSNWPSVTEIPTYNAVSRWKQHKRMLLDELKGKIDTLPLDLIDKMLTLDPSLRISTIESIQHQWIANLDPSKLKPLDLPEDANLNEMSCKKERKLPKIRA